MEFVVANVIVLRSHFPRLTLASFSPGKITVSKELEIFLIMTRFIVSRSCPGNSAAHIPA
jgi:hypothetical protein